MRHTLILLCTAAALAAPAVAGAAETKFSTALTATAEVPAPGAADKGSGSAKLTLDPAKGQVCYELTSKGTDAPTMAHIHKGAAGVAGPPVATLTAPANGMAKDCTAVPAETVAAIIASPADYYVNIHTKMYPAGAMRGQLGK